MDRAPDINRNSKGQCLQAFDTPSMGYMDKTVFWRNRVMGGAGVKLEPCRADCLNVSAAALVRLLACLKKRAAQMWIECEFDSADAGIQLVGGKGDW